MPDVKSAVKRLRDLSAGVMHQDIGKSDLFRETADMLEWYDRELYAQKEENRRLLRELIPLKEYDREQRKIVEVKAKYAASTAGPAFGGNAKILAKASVIQKFGRDLDEMGLIQWNVQTDANGRVTAEATLRVAHPIAEYIPADPGWFARNHIAQDSPLMTE